MKYVMQKCIGSYCKYCWNPVSLLIEEFPTAAVKTPIFYICFDCEKTFQAGVGEVESVKDDI